MVQPIWLSSCSPPLSRQAGNFSARGADLTLSLRPAIGVLGQFNRAVEDGDARRLVARRHRRKPGDLAGFKPCLLERPSEALPADAGKLDGGVVIDVPENLPGACGDGAAVEFGHSSAVHLNGAFRGHGVVQPLSM